MPKGVECVELAAFPLVIAANRLDLPPLDELPQGEKLLFRGKKRLSWRT